MDFRILRFISSFLKISSGIKNRNDILRVFNIRVSIRYINIFPIIRSTVIKETNKDNEERVAYFRIIKY